MELASLDPNQFAVTILQYATSGNWRALAAVAVLGVVWMLRTWALHPKALGRFAWLAWFKTDRGGVALNFLVSGLGGVGNALAAHAPVNAAVLLTAAVNACISAGVFVSVKRLAEKSPDPSQAADPIPVPVAADDRAITVTTKTEVPK